MKSLTLEQINLLCPEHSRTSCDDEHLVNHHFNSNSYADRGRYLPRCNRCFLIDCLRDDYWPEAITMTAQVSLSWTYLEKPCTKCGCNVEHKDV